MTDSILVPWSGRRITDSNDNPYESPKLFFYEAGPGSARTVYSDPGLTTPLGVSVTADSGGKVPLIYTGTGNYALVIKTNDESATIDTYDNLPGALDTSGFLTESVSAALPVIIKTSAYTVVSGDFGKLIAANPTGGAFAITLPSAATIGDGSALLAIEHSGTTNTNSVTITPDGSETIGGLSEYVLTGIGHTIMIASDGADWHVVSEARPAANARMMAAASLGFTMLNGTLDVSVAASALTVAIKTASGDDPSALDPVVILFRNATASTGTYVRREITAATSLTISSGSTLGTSNDVAFRLWLTAHDDSGTIRLGLSNRKTSTGVSPLVDGNLYTTTAEGGAGGADSAGTIYTGSAATSKPLAVLAYLEWSSGLSTAGTWSSEPDVIHLKGHGTKLPGDVVQVQRTLKTDSNSLTTPTTFTDITGLSVAISPSSTPNLVMVETMAHFSGASNGRIYFNLVRNSTSIGQGDAEGNRTQALGAAIAEGVTNGEQIGWAGLWMDAPQSTSSTTYKLQASIHTGNLAINRGGTDTDSSSFYRTSSSIFATEIMA